MRPVSTSQACGYLYMLPKAMQDGPGHTASPLPYSDALCRDSTARTPAPLRAALKATAW